MAHLAGRSPSDERTAFLRSLDWTGPAADLYDAVLEFLWDAETAKRSDPEYAAAFEEHLLHGGYDDVFLTYEATAEWADEIVRRRLK